MHDNAASASRCVRVDSGEATPEIVSRMNQNLIDAGHAGMRVTLKSDREPAMKSLKGPLALKRVCETFIILSPPRESRSNRAVQKAIQVLLDIYCVGLPP